MDVHIHGLHGHIDLQHAGREAAHHDLVAVRLLQRGGEQTGFDIAVVDKKALPGAVAARGGRLCDEAAHAQLFPAAVDRQHIVGQLPAIDGVDCGHAVALPVGVQLLLPVLQKAEGDLRVRERLLLHDGENSGGLRRVGFHELHPRGRVVKQLPHQNCRAARASGRLLGQDLPRLQMQPDAVFRALRPREQVDLRHGRNGRQRLAPETKRADAGKILFFADLARRVAQKRRAGVDRLHAAAVVGDAQESHAAVL